MSQCERILKYMNEHGSITTLEAFVELGVTRLSGRIHDLRQKGYEIESERIDVKNRFGDTITCCKYSIADKQTVGKPFIF